MPTSDETKNSPEGKACPASEGMISDAENNSNQINTIKGRGGYWYTFVDSNGSSITPTAGSQGGTFAMTAGGANGSKYAARMTGQVGTAETVYAGMAMNFVDPKGTYDGTAYKGISFWAKKGPGSTSKVRLKVPDTNTDPDGKVCKECYNDFGMDLVLTDNWTQYVVPYVAMTQMKDWGSPRMPGIDSSQMYAIQFQVNDKGAPYDIWVDDIEFTGCP
ncbi:MAG: carbohydrate binding domain-containing protein [Pseudomonadota bacterium]